MSQAKNSVNPVSSVRKIKEDVSHGGHGEHGVGMSEGLPKGWIDIRIGDVVGIHNGYAFKTLDFKKSGIPLIKQTNLVGDTVILEDCQYLDAKFLKEKENFILKKGDILIAMSGSLGKVSVYRNEFPALQNQRTGKLKFYSSMNLSRNLFLYCFTNIAYILEKSGKGCGVQNISGGEIEDLPFHLPPLNEQKRIVAKLDAIMPRIEAVKARLDKVPGILKRFRQSVLTAAVTGKLTEQWREEHPEVESAEVLLERIKEFRINNAENSRELNAVNKHYSEGAERLQDKESEYSLPDTWVYCEINSIGNVYNGSTPSRKVDSYWNGTLNWVSSGEVANLRIKSTREQITQEGFDNSSVKLFPKGTVLIAMIGEGKTRGQTAILDIESTCNQNVAAVVINHGLVLPEYLYNWFFMQDERNRSFGSGSGPKALNCQRVREIDFNLPPLEEQKEIVRQVDKLFALADKVETHYQKAKARVDKLSQSVLAKAFRGELVPQDPNDLPAAELLKQILAEKDKMAAQLKKRKTKNVKQRK